MQIKMQGICKSFGENKVLENASFELGDGEVHALMGENGAGKSTLMKILTGLYTKDAGEIFIDGNKVSYKNPKDAENNGIVFIHQELNIMFDLTVLQNLYVGKEIKNHLGFCDDKKMFEEANLALNALGVNISPKEVMSNLSVGKQQMIEICKALMANAKIIIMDEPTAALTKKETDLLFEVINSLRKKGVSIVYISHRMEEIFEICDKISILRDGSYVGTREIKNTDITEIVKMMIGRDIGERFPTRDTVIKDEVLRVCNLNKKDLFNNISFSVKSGEILGVSGLMGAGRTEVMNCIFGSLKLDSGDIFINDIKTTIKSPLDAIKNGIGFITEDRKVEGLMLEESIRKNIAISNLDRVKGLFINKLDEKNLVQTAIKDLNIKCFGSEHKCTNLSGGNQQKVVFAKWIYKDIKILILDEPTRGVDIGAKKEIYNIINKLTKKGVAIIMVSSELPEVIGVSDRVMVMREGSIRGILNKENCNEENIMILATGGNLDV